jgi:1-acyl-sn-glycerol-3-phosphate acyltransferase
VGGLLRQGCRVTAFLEGGAGPGTEVRPFKSSLLDAAAERGVPCVGVALRYTLPDDPALDPGRTVAWIDDDFAAHLMKLLGVRRIECHVTFLSPVSGTDRKALARTLEEQVRAALTTR